MMTLQYMRALYYVIRQTVYSLLFIISQTKKHPRRVLFSILKGAFYPLVLYKRNKLAKVRIVGI